MKTEKWLIHTIFECQDCDAEFLDYMTAQESAWNHAKKKAI